MALAVVNLAALVLCLTSYPRLRGATIAASTVSFVAAIAVCQLVFLEHGRSVRPSSLLLFYLLACVICEGVLLKSFYHGRVDSVSGPVLTAAFGLKLVLLAVESRSKKSYLREPYKDLPELETISDLNRIALFWVNHLILLGNRKLLSFPDLPSLDRPLTSERLRERLGTAWEKTSRQRVLSHTHGWKILTPEKESRNHPRMPLPPGPCSVHGFGVSRAI